MKMNNYFQYTFLTIGESKHYVLVKDFYKFMYNQPNKT